MPRAKPRLIDRLLGRVGLERRARGRDRFRVYAAAQASRLTADWFTAILSADAELKTDLRRLRGAARSLVRDNSYASRYVTMLGENIIGHTGIQLQARLRASKSQLNTEVNDQVEAAWAEWGQPETCDIGRRLSWVEMQHQIIRTLAQDGEVLVRLIPGAPNAFGFALQVLDVDLLDDAYSIDESRSPTGNEIRFGVELGRFGEPLAYHVWTRHPGDTFGPVSATRVKRERIPADEIIHLYVQLRPGQTRGVTWFAPVMLDQKMLQGYQEAEITAARVAASNMFAVAFDPEKAGGDLAEAEPGANEVPMQAEPGLGFRLGPGETLVQTNFSHPSTAFGPFSKSISRSLSTGLNVAYTSLTGDLEAVNYSSIRTGLLTERDFYRRMQGWIATYLHRRVYRAWLPHAALAGYVPPRMVTGLQASSAAKWRPRGWAWVDPSRDIDAARQRIALGVDTRTTVIAEHSGGDFEEIIAQLAEESAIAAAAGVGITGEPHGSESAGSAGGGEPDDSPTAATGEGEPSPPRAAIGGARPVTLIRGS